VPSEVADVPVRAEGCRPEAPAIEASHLSRRYSMVKDIVSAMSLRSLRRRSGGILTVGELPSSSKLLTRKPIKPERTSNAAPSRCEISGYFSLLSCSSRFGNEERKSIRRRFTNRYEKGFLSSEGEELSRNSKFGQVDGYCCRRMAASCV